MSSCYGVRGIKKETRYYRCCCTQTTLILTRKGLYVHQLLIQVLEFGPCDTWDCALPVFVPSIFTVSRRKKGKKKNLSFRSYGDEEAEICFSLFLPSRRRCLANGFISFQLFSFWLMEGS